MVGAVWGKSGRVWTGMIIVNRLCLGSVNQEVNWETAEKEEES